MSGIYQVQSSFLRYIVPFQLKESFETACKKIENQKEKIIKKGISSENQSSEKYRYLWERVTSMEDGAESDLYGYVRNEFRFEDENQDLSEQKTGCQWLFWRSDEAKGKDGRKIKELLFFPDGIKKEERELPEGWNFTVSNVGLYLFRNGLGFFWYELKLPKKELDSQKFQAFQNTIRELNRGKTSSVWEKTSTRPEFGVVLKEERGHKTYISPFLFGCWIHEMIQELDVRYFAERKNSWNTMMKKNMSRVEMLSNEIIRGDIVVYDTEIKVPDKAILFTYGTLKTDPKESCYEDRYDFLFHIANGYNSSYHFSDEAVQEIRRPFEDVCWYATQEGAAYLVWPGEDNRAVFENLMPSKVKTDYFTLYMKVLYQSFSLLIYAEKIQSELSAVNKKYLEEPMEPKITELFGEINLFLTKSMATSVSHIHHQSEFYVYLKKQLRIHEDVKSVTAGLHALDTLQREQLKREERQREAEAWKEEQRRDHEEQCQQEARELREKKRDGKLQAIMGLFALLGISSALADGFDFIGKFDPSGDFWKMVPRTQTGSLILFVVIGIISAIAIYFSVKAIVDAFRDRD